MRKAQILVVEDSATQRHALTALLDSLSYEVTTAEDGEHAFELITSRRFDLVLSDVVMPGMSGFDLCRKIKRETAPDNRPPVILLTSMSDPRDIVRGLEAGADNYLTKPYHPEQLAVRIDRALREGPQPSKDVPDAPSVGVVFLGEEFEIRADPQRILRLLLSSFEDVIRVNQELHESQRQLAAAHQRELEQEQRAREEAEATAVHLEKLRQQAEAATRARDDVLAAVSHDLRNPVSTIFTAASLVLEMEELTPATQQRQLEIIRRTALRMDRLIQDLLDVARLENGALVISVAVESAASLLQEVSDSFRNVATAADISLTVEKPAHDVNVSIDRGRILQVFSNLIGNAIKFTPAGGAITVSATVSGERLLCTVSDNGAGIPEVSLPHVFDRFWQGKEKRAAGAGLGLAIAKGIVDAHNGTIRATSQPGVGSTFSFDIPLQTK